LGSTLRGTAGTLAQTTGLTGRMSDSSTPSKIVSAVRPYTCWISAAVYREFVASLVASAMDDPSRVRSRTYRVRWHVSAARAWPWRRVRNQQTSYALTRIGVDHVRVDRLYAVPGTSPADLGCQLEVEEWGRSTLCERSARDRGGMTKGFGGDRSRGFQAVLDDLPANVRARRRSEPPPGSYEQPRSPGMKDGHGGMAPPDSRAASDDF